MPDKNGYPTRSEIELLKKHSGSISKSTKYDIDDYDPDKTIKHLEEIWWATDWGFKRDGYKLELHTGGWSGNETIIEVLQHSLFWMFFWQRSERGGHYYFEPICEAVTGVNNDS